MDVLGQLLEAGNFPIRSFIFKIFSCYCIDSLISVMFLEENVERDAVHKALMSLLRQDAKGKLLKS